MTKENNSIPASALKVDHASLFAGDVTYRYSDEAMSLSIPLDVAESRRDFLARLNQDIDAISRIGDMLAQAGSDAGLATLNDHAEFYLPAIGAAIQALAERSASGHINGLSEEYGAACNQAIAQYAKSERRNMAAIMQCMEEVAHD